MAATTDEGLYELEQVLSQTPSNNINEKEQLASELLSNLSSLDGEKDAPVLPQNFPKNINSLERIFETNQKKATKILSKANLKTLPGYKAGILAKMGPKSDTCAIYTNFTVLKSSISDVYIILGPSHLVIADELDDIEGALLKDLKGNTTANQSSGLCQKAIRAYNALNVLFDDTPGSKKKTAEDIINSNLKVISSPNSNAQEILDVMDKKSKEKSTVTESTDNTKPGDTSNNDNNDDGELDDYYVDMLMKASKVSRKQAVDALLKCNGDYVNAALFLSENMG